MKLYYAPGACSLSPHIALAEAGLAADYVKVNLQDKKTEAGDDYLKVNPKGQVPVLGLDGGGVLTEGPAIVQYIADKAPNSKLAPANGTNERYQLQEWLNMLTSELHKSFSPLFNPVMPDEAKNIFRDKIGKSFGYHRRQARGPGLPDGQPVHGRRRLPVHHAALGARAEVRHRAVPEPEGLFRPRRRTAEGEGSDARRRTDQGGVS